MVKQIYRGKKTLDYKVDITVTEWKEILCLPEVQRDKNMLPALEKWYRVPEHTSTCTAMGEMFGHSQQYFSRHNWRLGQVAVRYLNRFVLIGDEGKEIFWAAAWRELGRNGTRYVMCLRPELVTAIEELGLFSAAQ